MKKNLLSALSLLILFGSTINAALASINCNKTITLPAGDFTSPNQSLCFQLSEQPPAKFTCYITMQGSPNGMAAFSFNAEPVTAGINIVDQDGKKINLGDDITKTIPYGTNYTITFDNSFDNSGKFIFSNNNSPSNLSIQCRKAQ